MPSHSETNQMRAPRILYPWWPTVEAGWQVIESEKADAGSLDKGPSQQEPIILSPSFLLMENKTKNHLSTWGILCKSGSYTDYDQLLKSKK